MFKENKDLYNYYIGMRNDYINCTYKIITDIDDFLRNESIGEKYIRFFDEFSDDSCIIINNTKIIIPGFTKFIFKVDDYEYGSALFDSLFYDIFIKKIDYIYDLMEQYIEEYKALRYDLDYIREKQYDDDYVVYMIGHYAERYINEFNIKNDNDIFNTLNQQINDYLNYLGLSVMDL